MTQDYDLTCNNSTLAKTTDHGNFEDIGRECSDSCATTKLEPYNIMQKNRVYTHTDTDLNTGRRIKTIIPYDTRLENYNRKREDIFRNFVPEVSKKVLKARKGYEKRKKERKEIASACISVEGDIRPYMDVKLNGFPFRGLMDSGAAVSCLGKGCIKNAERMNLPISNFKSSINTADGKPLTIIGKVKLSIQCGNKSEEMTFYLVPALKQSLILGYDSWQRLGIKIAVPDHSICEIESQEEDTKAHRLTPQEHTILENVKLSFRCYTRFGLGRTNWRNIQ